MTCKSFGAVSNDSDYSFLIMALSTIISNEPYIGFTGKNIISPPEVFSEIATVGDPSVCVPQSVGNQISRHGYIVKQNTHCVRNVRASWLMKVQQQHYYRYHTVVINLCYLTRLNSVGLLKFGFVCLLLDSVETK